MSKKIIKKVYNTLGQEYYDKRKKKKSGSYFYNELLEFPTTLRILGDIKNKKILDLGCGPGIHANKMYKLGAKVKGVDLSERLIDIARREVPEVKFILGDIEDLPYRNNEFDVVIASLVLGHLKYWDKVLSEVKRVLKKKGIFVFSIHNPVTNKFVRKRKLFGKYRELRGYFDEGVKKSTWKGKSLSLEVAHYHKTYGTVVRTLIRNGFEIVDYEDCKPVASAKKNFPSKYQRAFDYPHFCVWKVKKK